MKSENKISRGQLDLRKETLQKVAERGNYYDGFFRIYALWLQNKPHDELYKDRTEMSDSEDKFYIAKIIDNQIAVRIDLQKETAALPGSTISTRMKGKEALNSDEFVTLNQVKTEIYVLGEELSEHGGNWDLPEVRNYPIMVIINNYPSAQIKLYQSEEMTNELIAGKRITVKFFEAGRLDFDYQDETGTQNAENNTFEKGDSITFVINSGKYLKVN